MSADITPELFDIIIEEVYNGLPPSKAAKKHNVKHKSFREFAQQSPDRLIALAHAEDACADHAAAEILDIADTEEDQLRSRNRIDARKWLASKFRPQKYGDRVDLNIHKVVDISGALAEAAGRLLPRRYPEDDDFSQALEITATKLKDSSGSKPDEPSKSVEESEPTKNEPLSIFD